MNSDTHESLNVIKIAKCHPDAVLPKYAYEGDAGFDIHTIEDIELRFQQRITIRTGLKIEVPKGYMTQVCPRSGYSTYTKLNVIIGTVDSGYRGEMHVVLHNHGQRVKIPKGSKIAQCIVGPVPMFQIIEVTEADLSPSERGERGIGSSGR